MTNKMFYTLLLQVLAVCCFAQQPDYAVSKIDPSLLVGASAVRRLEMVRFEIKDAGSAVYYYKTATTILNENGEDHASWQEGYDDKFTTIRSVDATLYDAAGKKIRSLKKADIADVTGAGSSLADDSRVKYHNFYCKLYPYTVEYEVEIKQEQLLFIQPWIPIQDEDFSVEKSVLEIITPPDYKIRYKVFNYDKEPVVTNGKEKTYRWEVKNLLPVKKEFASPSFQEISTSVFAAPTDFQVQGYKGVMSSWLEFGKFQSQLNQNRDQLPANIKLAVHNLTDSVKDVKKKIAMLYKYMQSNTRYISIQLGIGGWQPLEASFVASKGYGDCKALSNYMHSILKEANIPSYYTLIQAGNNNTFYLPDFPSRQSNHAILSVPLDRDTVWLECTDQNLPAGYLGGFTSNRYALMIKDDGGHLVHTPNYIYSDNLQIRKISSVINEEGKLSADVNTHYTGQQQDDLFGILNFYSKKEQLEYLKKEIDLPSYDISSFNYSSSLSGIPAIDENIKLVADNYAQVSGKRIFIQPDLLNKIDFRLPDENRLNDIELKMGFRDEDSVEIKIPAGFTVEAMPAPVAVQGKFGTYKISYSVDGEKVFMNRLFERKSGRYPASDYKELVKMYSDMYKADRAKIVLVKKE